MFSPVTESKSESESESGENVCLVEGPPTPTPTPIPTATVHSHCHKPETTMCGICIKEYPRNMSCSPHTSWLPLSARRSGSGEDSCNYAAGKYNQNCQCRPLIGFRKGRNANPDRDSNSRRLQGGYAPRSD